MEGMTVQRISINEIEDFRIGNAQDLEGGTGCTVILCDEGMAAGLDIRGGGPASRESGLLEPRASAQAIHGLVLSGGSAFGLGAAGGVMDYFKERGIGFDTGIAKIPLVCQSDIFDLGVGSPDAYPDPAMAYAACLDAEKNEPKSGNVGAGIGATVGKIKGSSRMMKSGLGIYAVALGEFKMGAIVSVNALGDIYDADTGRKLAGLLNADHTGFEDSCQAMYTLTETTHGMPMGNTTIGAIITNGRFNKVQLGKIASMAHNGMARAIRPVHTSMDGDSIYALSRGEVTVDVDVAGTLAADVMAWAIADAVLSATPLYGLKTAKEIL